MLLSLVYHQTRDSAAASLFKFELIVLLNNDMPIYEYSCEKCGSVIERIQKFSDPLLSEHENCGGVLTKLISRSAFHLKGDGWYVTDYARKDSKEGGEEDKKDATNKTATESEGVQTNASDGKNPKDTPSSIEKSTTKKETTSTASNTSSTDGAGT